MYIRKSISIKPEHQKYIDDTHLNFSRFIQHKLDELMEAKGNEHPAYSDCTVTIEP